MLPFVKTSLHCLHVYCLHCIVYIRRQDDMRLLSVIEWHRRLVKSIIRSFVQKKPEYIFYSLSCTCLHFYRFQIIRHFHAMNRFWRVLQDWSKPETFAKWCSLKLRLLFLDFLGGRELCLSYICKFRSLSFRPQWWSSKK